MSDNRIQSEGATNLANVISGSKISLHTLLLRNCCIEDDGIQNILDALAHPNSSIKRLHLWGNNVSLAAKERENLLIQFSHGGSKKLEEIMKNRILLEINSDCRASSSWHPDGAYSLGLTVILIITIVTSNFFFKLRS